MGIKDSSSVCGCTTLIPELTVHYMVPAASCMHIELWAWGFLLEVC